MSTTRVEWATHSVNPMTGCTPISAGCDHCYAARMAKRLAANPKLPEATRRKYEGFRPGQYHPARLDEIANAKAGSRVFVVSMGDLFHEAVNIRGPEVRSIFRAIASSEATCLILTKRPERMAKAVEYLYGDELAEACPNLWLGVTAENQYLADERIPVLLKIPAAVHFVSVEPMLGPVDLRPYPLLHKRWGLLPEGIDWVICGAETGPGARPMNIAWARELRVDCQRARVPFFFKKVGPGLPTPPDLEVREFPEVQP